MINFNIAKRCFGPLHKPLLHIFNLSILRRIFTDKLKIARIMYIFKGVNELDIDNNRPIPIFSCFSKMLEKIMYKRVYKILNENNLLYKNQFGFQKAHCTEYAIIQLVDQMNNSY